MFDLPLLKELASGIAFVLTFVLFVPYIRSVRRQTTVPHVFSWVIWAFGTFVVFLAQLADGAGVGAWPIGFSACITSYIALLSYRARSSIEISSQDWLLLVLAAAAIPGWILASDPLWAVVFLTIADLLGFGPTLRKAYTRPHQEHMGFFALGGVRNALVVVALENYSWTTMLFPAAVGASCALVALFLAVRRASVPPGGLKDADNTVSSVLPERVLTCEKMLLVCLVLVQTIVLGNVQSARAGEFELQVDTADQACDVDSDCSLVYDRCDSCSCGVGVNRRHQDDYLAKLNALCENFSGAHCDKLCTPLSVKCIDSRCRVLDAGEGKEGHDER